MRILNVANGDRLGRVWTPEFLEALRALGDLSLEENGVSLSDDQMLERGRSHEVAIVGWDARPLPAALAQDPGALRYVCCYSGTLRAHVPKELVEAGILVSNWGDHPANGVAEAAMTLLLGVLKDLPKVIGVARDQKWGVETRIRGTLAGTRVGIYGCGVIGRRFVELLQPFGSQIRIYDPFAEALPEGSERADSLDAWLLGAKCS